MNVALGLLCFSLCHVGLSTYFPESLNTPLSSGLGFRLVCLGRYFFFPFKSPLLKLSQLDSLVPGTSCHPGTHIFNSFPLMLITP